MSLGARCSPLLLQSSTGRTWPTIYDPAELSEQRSPHDSLALVVALRFQIVWHPQKLTTQGTAKSSLQALDTRREVEWQMQGVLHGFGPWAQVAHCGLPFMRSLGVDDLTGTCNLHDLCIQIVTGAGTWTISERLG